MPRANPAQRACDDDFGSVYILLLHGRTRHGRMYRGIHTLRLHVEQGATKCPECQRPRVPIIY
jgi:hypothetical protein